MANTYKLTLDTLNDAARTTVAAVVSLLLARVFRLPESYWAPISAIVIISIDNQSEDGGLATVCRDCAGRGPRGISRYIFLRQRAGVWGCSFFVRSAMCGSTIGRSLPFCRDHAEHHCIDRTSASGVDRGFASLCGSVGGHCSGARRSPTVAWSRCDFLGDPD